MSLSLRYKYKWSMEHTNCSSFLAASVSLHVSVIDTSIRTSEPQTLRVDLLNLKIYILAAQIGGPVM